MLSLPRSFASLPHLSSCRRLFAIGGAIALSSSVLAPSTSVADSYYRGGITSQRVTQNVQKPATDAKSLNWAESMFSELEHDFGNVAAGADVTHELVLENPYEETVRIVNVDKTCGCTQAKVSRYEIPTHETATVSIAMDTMKFRDEKRSNVIITLAFTSPSGQTAQETVRVPIRAFIRKDVVIEPGGANFGIVESGTEQQRTLLVKYAGRPDWAITDVESGNDNIETTLGERTVVPGGVTYELNVKLDPSAPVGELRDRVLLRTNDGANQTVPVLVSANVEPDIVVTPGRVAFGAMRPGEKKRQSVVIRGKRPFEIAEFACIEHEGAFTVPSLAGRKTLFVIPITVTAPDQPGEMTETFEITIAGRDEPITFEAYGTIK